MDQSDVKLTRNLQFIGSISVGGSKLQLTFNCKFENGTIVEMRQEMYNLNYI